MDERTGSAMDALIHDALFSTSAGRRIAQEMADLRGVVFVGGPLDPVAPVLVDRSPPLAGYTTPIGSSAAGGVRLDRACERLAEARSLALDGDAEGAACTLQAAMDEAAAAIVEALAQAGSR